jgi:LmbE family N-acetylglucosaminyl deacetylase
VRAQEVRAATALPADRLVLLGQPDGRASHFEEIGFAPAVECVRGIAGEFECDRILATWEHDPHCDHLAAWQIAAEATRRSRLQLGAYPVWGWTLEGEVAAGPVSGFCLDISTVLAMKRRAIRAHESQHGSLIPDDASGFSLPHRLLAIADAPFETFLLP